jgi:phosphorylcholine metabolism protein LicD
MNNFSKSEFFKILDYSRSEQKIRLRIFKNFYNICHNNNIKFSLCEGSLLGCIRHNDFIPWDDDVDIYMTHNSFSELKKHIEGTENQLLKTRHVDKEKKYPILYFFKSVTDNKKIDIFLEGFKKEIYKPDEEYIKKTFNTYEVLVPTNYKDVLSKLYPDWENSCYISNHKIAKEKFKGGLAYNNNLLNQYSSLPLEQAKEWVEEYDKK